ncbi:JmjC domain-containing histone demethylation protein [Lachnellula suecica]|uniref:JmjC domain-containing histone demethylation protein n=1 Tax=Lachnellula suecica TaxID=602035 RepID=A0A8T9BXS3_9HELO|nr:JmjC domain-containing histone demethylation protein [Lachnellula suecica]
MPASKLVTVGGSANSVEALFNSLQGFDRKLINAMREMPLSPLKNMSWKAQEVWEKTTTTYPRLFPAKDCWLQEPPRQSDLILETLEIIERQVPNQEDTFDVHFHGELSTIDPRIAVAQLSDPNPTGAIDLVGLRAAHMEEDMVTTPRELSKIMQAHDRRNFQLLLTPKYCHTDLHIDSGEGLGVPLGACEKIWICYPPTVKNFDLYTKSRKPNTRLENLGRNLEGGVIFRMTPNDAVYLPVGCIHTVFTITGGFLHTMDFVTPESSRGFVKLLGTYLDVRGFNSPFTVQCFEQFLASIDLALSHNRIQLAVSSWLEALDPIRQYAENDKIWRKDMTVIWEEFLETAAAKKIICPCGRGVRGNFSSHFQAEHLWKKVRTPLKAVSSAPKRGIIKKLRERKKRNRDEDGEWKSAKRVRR